MCLSVLIFLQQKKQCLVMIYIFNYINSAKKKYQLCRPFWNVFIKKMYYVITDTLFQTES